MSCIVYVLVTVSLPAMCCNYRSRFLLLFSMRIFLNSFNVTAYYILLVQFILYDIIATLSSYNSVAIVIRFPGVIRLFNPLT